MFLVLPLIARADDDENVPLSPQQLAAQRTVLGVIGAIVLLLVGFYLFRRWQTVHSGNIIEGGYGDDD
jgi:predicted secreted protein